ncbi:recombinase family protein [Streptomyces mobaraensis]|uniref:recombinase family protein n=1 Tax=Streptomyces mobaraensis TaxID=35621 RepID=UPI0033FF7CF6
MPIDAVARSARTRTLRAVDYLRVSTEEQKKGFGVASQGKRTRKHITGKGWEHVDTYVDDGISGSLESDDRPDLARLMLDAAEHLFDVVVVKEGRAIGRTGRAFWRWVWALEDIGIFVAIVDGDIDNTTPEGRREMRRQADYAETEWETIRIRTQDGLQEKAVADGSPHIGGRPPFGYRIADQGKVGLSRLVIDENESATIRRVYKWLVEEGVSFSIAALRLNAAGCNTRSGKPWTDMNLRDRILSSPILDGTLTFRGTHAKRDEEGVPIWGDAVKITLPRVLSEQEATTLRRQVASRAGKSSRNGVVYPLSGRLVSLCGRLHSGAGRGYYRCDGKTDRLPGAEHCDCSLVDAEATEKRVWSEVVSFLGNSQKLEELAAEWIGITDLDHSVHEDRIEELDGQIVNLKAALSSVIVATAKQCAGSATAPDVIAGATASLNKEIAQLQQMRDDAVAWLAEKQDAAEKAESLHRLVVKARTELVTMTAEEQMQIYELLDLKVTVEGPVPQRKKGVTCSVQAWYRERELQVPASDLTDEEWEAIAHLLPSGRGRTVRRSVNAILCKARTGVSWPSLRPEYGSMTAPSKFFGRWVSDGTWARVDAALSGAARVPLPVVDLYPPMRIEGRFDPRVMVSADTSSRTGSSR